MVEEHKATRKERRQTAVHILKHLKEKKKKARQLAAGEKPEKRNFVEEMLANAVQLKLAE